MWGFTFELSRQLLAFGQVHFYFLKLNTIKPDNTQITITTHNDGTIPEIKENTQKSIENNDDQGVCNYLQKIITARDGWDIRSAYTFSFIFSLSFAFDYLSLPFPADLCDNRHKQRPSSYLIFEGGEEDPRCGPFGPLGTS